MKIKREAILWYALQYQGEWKSIAKAIKNHEAYRIVEYPYAYVTIVDVDYPDCLKRIQFPPWILFYEGKHELLQEVGVGIIGARDCSMRALKNTQYITSLLSDRYMIVSGLAKGIDAMAHQSAKKTLGILGCGIDIVYPKQNQSLFENMRKKQLIISEYPMGAAPLAYHFPWRNRLIVAFSKALIVIEATYKSGTMLTVNEAIELDIPIYCVPSAFDDKKYPGCNYLISVGANILVDENDINDI